MYNCSCRIIAFICPRVRTVPDPYLPYQRRLILFKNISLRYSQSLGLYPDSAVEEFSFDSRIASEHLKCMSMSLCFLLFV